MTGREVLRKVLQPPVILLISASIAVFLLFSSLAPYSNPPSYMDQVLYINCGKMLFRGLTPLQCNFEHPPLGKYLIGLFFSIGVPWLLNFLLYGVMVLFLYLTFSQISGDVAFFTTLLITTDSLVLNVFRYYLLDPSAFSFTAVSLALFFMWVKKKESMRPGTSVVFSIAFSIFTGASIACKWQAIFPLLVIPVYLLWELINSYFATHTHKGIKEGAKVSCGCSTAILNFIVFLLTSLTVYSSAFVMDAVRYGFLEIFNHNFKMISYMSHRHPLSFPLAIIALLKLLGRVEYWFYPGNISILISLSTSIVNSSVISIPIIVNSTFTQVNKHYLIIYIGLTGISWYLLFPSYLFYLWKGLSGKLCRLRALVLAVASLSLINLLYGELDWYYIYVIPFLYFILSDILLTSFRDRGKLLLIIMVVAQFLQLLLALLKVLPWFVTIIT